MGSDAFAAIDVLGPGASERERLLADTLLGAALERSARANLGAKDSRTGAALSKWERLVNLVPNLKPLQPLRFEGDLDTSEQNEAILMVVAQYVRGLPKNTAGDLVRSDTVSGSVSAVKLIAEEHFHRKVVCATGGLALRRAVQHMAREDGPAGERGYSAPMRRQHLDALAAPGSGFDIRSPGWATDRWSTMQASHQALMRGGEPGTVDGGEFSSAKGITWAHVTWTDPTTGRPAVVTLGSGAVHSVVTLAVVPIKDQTGKAKRFPCPIISKHPAADIAAGRVDLTCPYTAIRRSWDARVDAAPWTELRTRPFFVGPDGVHAVTTEQLRDMAIRPAARCLGLVASQFGGSALRRGGATDLKKELGSAQAKAMITQRGRWADYDIGDIYSRASVEEQAETSAALNWASTFRTMEEANPGWVQPTHWARR